jgi:hypothetical protein
MKLIYKITFPNGKIYIGSDLTNTFRYFGSWDSQLVASDFSEEEQKDFTIRREIIWQSEKATKEDVLKKEMELIRKFEANNPSKGYNKNPPFH